MQFLLPNLCDRIAAILEETGLAPQRLELEISEAAFVRGRSNVIATLMRLHGLVYASSWTTLEPASRRFRTGAPLPFHKIKVDRSFTGLLELDATARSIVRAIIGLGHSLGIQVATEGVEIELQRKIVIEEGCEQLQGLLFGKPDIEPSVKLAGREKLLQVHRLRSSANITAAE